MTATEQLVLRYVPPESTVEIVQPILIEVEKRSSLKLPDPSKLTMSICSLISETAMGPNGELVPPEVAAAQVVELFDHVRTVEKAPATGTDPPEASTEAPVPAVREPLGVQVNVNVELAGLRDQAVWLRWSIYPQAGGARLYDKWLDPVVASQLVPSTDHDTGSVRLWIPLPADPGPYVAELELFANGHRLASATSDPFT